MAADQELEQNQKAKWAEQQESGKKERKVLGDLILFFGESHYPVFFLLRHRFPGISEHSINSTGATY